MGQTFIIFTTEDLNIEDVIAKAVLLNKLFT